MVLAAIAVGVVAVGLSAAATMSQGDSAQPANEVQRVKPAKKAVSRASERNVDAPVVVSSGRSQSSQEVEQYWTKERMEDAQPMEKTRQRPSHQGSPAPSTTSSVATAPGRAPTKIAPTRKPSAKRAQSADDTSVVSSPAVSNPNYWTDEAMDDAQPMDKTRPGGSGPQSDPDLGGTTVPASPPP